MKRLVLAAALAGFATTATAADLKICVEGAYPPFSEVTPSGEIVGFDIDIANALCGAMGKSCEMVQTEWDGIIPALIEGKCDAIIASMSITEERKKAVDFTEKYYYTPAKFIGREGAGLSDTPEGMKGKVVGVQRGTIHQDYMEGKFPGVELRLYGTQDEAYLDLQAGRVDAVVADSVAMDYGFLRTDAGKGFAFFGGDHYDPAFHGPGAGIAVRKDDDALEAALNKAIKDIRASGEYTAIANKYFDFDVYGS
ncbi:transporter substrate-binding domain-containing protein [Limibaculum sp. FT325]|uniref:transporter substrate-binding domain-containing protein n=1 Tax=Thermohalobaculum sediminis TaxID=2939436 RepID=UPI0020BEE67D|nr:transporter substrate-binding domain-containing protein [Limibaculum sediminis]MCL5777037.1 transporter substrate-binding domain-containing protein [Limibaculum sediminis]